jgi:hypothetical protein
MDKDDQEFKLKLKATFVREEKIENEMANLKRKLHICGLQIKCVNEYRDKLIFDRYQKKQKVL